MKKPAVRNAASPKEVKRAARKAKDREEQLLDATRRVMADEAGRLMVWELLGRASVFGSIFAEDSGLLYYKSGRQDFGHELMALVIEADPGLYLQMEAEARARDRKDDVDNEAAHTAAAGDNTEETEP